VCSLFHSQLMRLKIWNAATGVPVSHTCNDRLDAQMTALLASAGFCPPLGADWFGSAAIAMNPSLERSGGALCCDHLLRNSIAELEKTAAETTFQARDGRTMKRNGRTMFFPGPDGPVQLSWNVMRHFSNWSGDTEDRGPLWITATKPGDTWNRGAADSMDQARIERICDLRTVVALMMFAFDMRAKRCYKTYAQAMAMAAILQALAGLKAVLRSARFVSHPNAWELDAWRRVVGFFSWWDAQRSTCPGMSKEWLEALAASLRVAVRLAERAQELNEAGQAELSAAAPRRAFWGFRMLSLTQDQLERLFGLARSGHAGNWHALPQGLLERKAAATARATSDIAVRRHAAGTAAGAKRKRSRARAAEEGDIPDAAAPAAQPALDLCDARPTARRRVNVAGDATPGSMAALDDGSGPRRDPSDGVERPMAVLPALSVDGLESAALGPLCRWVRRCCAHWPQTSDTRWNPRVVARRAPAQPATAAAAPAAAPTRPADAAASPCRFHTLANPECESWHTTDQCRGERLPPQLHVEWKAWKAAAAAQPAAAAAAAAQPAAAATAAAQPPPAAAAAAKPPPAAAAAAQPAAAAARGSCSGDSDDPTFLNRCADRLLIPLEAPRPNAAPSWGYVRQRLHDAFRAAAPAFDDDAADVAEQLCRDLGMLLALRSKLDSIERSPYDRPTCFPGPWMQRFCDCDPKSRAAIVRCLLRIADRAVARAVTEGPRAVQYAWGRSVAAWLTREAWVALSARTGAFEPEATNALAEWASFPLGDKHDAPDEVHLLLALFNVRIVPAVFEARLVGDYAPPEVLPFPRDAFADSSAAVTRDVAGACINALPGRLSLTRTTLAQARAVLLFCRLARGEPAPLWRLSEEGLAPEARTLVRDFAAAGLTYVTPAFLAWAATVLRALQLHRWLEDLIACRPSPHADASTAEAFQLRLLDRAKAAEPVVDGFAALPGADALRSEGMEHLVRDEVCAYLAHVGLKAVVKEANLNAGGHENRDRSIVQARVAQRKRKKAAAAAAAADR
jgi:hypothetical protein